MLTHRWQRIQLLGFFIPLLCAIVLGFPLSIASPALGDEPLTGATTSTLSPRTDNPSWLITPPQKAYTLLRQLEERGGTPLPGYIGGRDFQNRERRLPRGRYREYDVNPKIRGRGRDAERIVIEQRTGKAYYTGDHYRTFVPLN